MSSSIYEGANNVSSYFHLHDINEDLQSQCANLELEVLALRNKIRLYEEKYNIDSTQAPEGLKHYDFILAHVINNSINKPYNYITINKGSKDGIKPEMGVVDQNGIVGIVNLVGENNSRVISLLNPKLKLSCKIKGNDNFGSLVWDKESPTEVVLEELPRHTVFKKGDTIVTSGYSAVFPEGIPIGTIATDGKGQNENFFTLKIKLFTDFTKLSTVRIVVNNMKEELDSLEVTDYQETSSN